MPVRQGVCSIGLLRVAGVLSASIHDADLHADVFQAAGESLYTGARFVALRLGEDDKKTLLQTRLQRPPVAPNRREPLKFLIFIRFH